MGQDRTACLKCDTIFSESRPWEDLKELEFDDSGILKEAAEKKEKGKINMDYIEHENNLVLSAKTIGVRNQIETCLKEEPNKKIIVFSEFHMIMQIFERICQRKGWKYCTYHGKMSHAARDKAIAEFGRDDEMKVMIASLKCGGLGLNLTMASKVILIDLWFNSCVEEQAFSRVFRIGQTSETFITRFIVKGTADDKLMEMQLSKDVIIGTAMNDRSMMSKLSVEEVMRLFGDVKHDKNNRPFIQMSNDEKLDTIFN